MTTLTRLAAALTVAAATVVAGGAPAANALAGDDYFVVDTQFRNSASSIIDAGGAFAGCTSVTDLRGEAVQLSPQRVLFRGEKRVSCGGGKRVTVYYEATTATGLVTIGTWTITSSTLAGATTGGGSLHGDSKTCTLDKNSFGCITDTFAGDVS